MPEISRLAPPHPIGVALAHRSPLPRQLLPRCSNLRSPGCSSATGPVASVRLPARVVSVTRGGMQSSWEPAAVAPSDPRSRFDAESLRRVKAELEGELQEAALPVGASLPRAQAPPAFADAPNRDRAAPATAATAWQSERGGIRRSASVAAPERAAPRAQSSLSPRPDEATAPRRASIATSGGLYERGLLTRQRLERERERVIEETKRAANPQLNP